MKKIFAIVVIYKEEFYSTTVYKHLLSKHIDKGGLRFLVYDNSPEPMNRVEEIAKNGGFYIHNCKNSGVSTAYNEGARIAEKIDGINYLLLLDQDTIFESDFVEKIEKAISSDEDCNLFVPFITYGKNIPFSPTKKSLKGSSGVKLEEGEYELLKYCPVNSGACVKLSIFKKAEGYNEKIKLDFADYDFFSRLGQISPWFKLINSHAEQSFSNEEKDVEKLLSRFVFFVDGAKYAIKNALIRKYVLIDVIKHTIALTIRTKSFGFIRVLMEKL